MEGGPSVEVAVLDRVIRVTSIADMEAYSAPVGYVFSLNAGGRSGDFDVIAGDFSTELAADTFNGIYVGQADDPTATTKVLKRRNSQTMFPQWFGALANGVFDDTLSVQAAINMATGKVVLPPTEGGYLLDLARVVVNGAGYHKIALTMKDNITIDATGAVIRAIKNDGTHGGFVSFSYADNAHVVGGTWIGDKLLHGTLPTGEFCSAFFISRTTGSSIKKALIQYSRGDGITLGYAYPTYQEESIAKKCSLLENIIEGAGRNGISVTGAEDYLIKGNQIFNTLGYSPEAGIDIEPGTTYTGGLFGSRHGIVSNNIVEDNRGYGIEVWRSNGVSVNDNIVKNCGKGGISLLGDVYNTVIKNNHISNTGKITASFGISMSNNAGLFGGIDISNNYVDSAACFDLLYPSSFSGYDGVSVHGNQFTVTDAAAKFYGSDNGAMTSNVFITNNIISNPDNGIVFKDNYYNMIAPTASSGLTSDRLVAIRKSFVKDNYFYSVSAATQHIRLDDNNTAGIFAYNKIYSPILPMFNARGATSSKFDWEKSYINGISGASESTNLVILEDTNEGLGWPLPTGLRRDGDSWTYESGVSHLGGLYRYRIWNDAAANWLFAAEMVV
jgi:parallel beta-helix repeat protein